MPFALSFAQAHVRISARDGEISPLSPPPLALRNPGYNSIIMSGMLAHRTFILVCG
jgi:hypothetical protein